MKTRKNSINLLIMGSADKCGLFLKSLTAAPGISVMGLVDRAPSARGLALARDMRIPLGLRLHDFKQLDDVDVVLDLSGTVESGSEAARFFEDKAPVLRGKQTKLLRILAALYRKQIRYEGKFRAVKREFDQYLDRNERIIGKSPQIEDIRELIDRVAATPTTVLLLGETGTGKDLAARSIHAASLIGDKPFISVNCTALTSTLIESELFGYRKGSFTGAESDRKGLLEEADGGTLFLDEIGDMQLELQAKMLRFLQTGEVRRVGSAQARRVNVRVIAATNRDLEKAIAEDGFRRDLYYRFNTFSIRLPALRERLPDIPYLAYHFLTRAEAKLNKRMDGITDEALELMRGYDWPGNVRELANVVERAVILARDGRIGPADLPEQIRSRSPEDAPERAPDPQPRGGEERGFSGGRERVMANFEKKEILYYMKKADGNISEASRLSGIPRRTFYRKLRKYDL